MEGLSWRGYGFWIWARRGPLFNFHMVQANLYLEIPPHFYSSQFSYSHSRTRNGRIHSQKVQIMTSAVQRTLYIVTSCKWKSPWKKTYHSFPFFWQDNPEWTGYDDDATQSKEAFRFSIESCFGNLFQNKIHVIDSSGRTSSGLIHSKQILVMDLQMQRTPFDCAQK